jgi:uncharacterized protein
MAQDVDVATLSSLLDLQSEDTAIARLNNRRESLPEALELARINEQLAELDADIEIATKQQEETARAQDRLEGEIALVTQKTEREESRMYSGGVSNPKELSSLQAEVEMLKKKRAGMEDELLEIMEQRERADQTLNSLQSERAAAAEKAGGLTATVNDLTGEIDAELQTHGRRRSEIAGGIPPDLMKLYEQLRDAKAGVGVAALEGGACQGCHTQLPAREVERLRSEGGLQRCDNCRRILVAIRA